MSAGSLATEYEALARANPAEALTRLDEFMARSDDEPAPPRVKLLRDGALAARATRDMAMSDHLANQAIAEAEAEGDHTGATWARITLAYNHFLAGQPTEGVQLLERLDPRGDPHLATVIKFQMATIVGRMGDNDRAVQLLTEAEQVGFDADGGFHQTQVLKNRGMFQARRGNYDDAADDLRHAQALAHRLGLDFEVAFCQHNLGLAASYVGDLAEAFRLFEEAERQIRELSGSDFESKVGHCRALKTAGLFTEAARTATAAADACEVAGFTVDGAECRLLAASAWLEAGDLTAAEIQARMGAAAYEAVGLSDWAACAEVTTAMATHRRGDPVDLAELRSLVAELSGGAPHRDRVEAALFQIEVEGGSNPEAAREHLARLRDEGSLVSLDLHLAALSTEASIATRANDPDAALDAATRGFDLLLGEQALVASAELRAGLSQHAQRLGQMGLDLALAHRQPADVADWQDRIKLAAATPRPVRPPAEPELRAALTRLRAADPEDPARPEMEERVRLLHRSRRAADRGGDVDDTGPPDATPPRPRGLSTSATAASLSISDGQLIATVADGQTCTLHRLGEAAVIERAMRAVRAEMRRRVRPIGASRAGDRAARLSAAMHKIDELVLGPLALPAEPVVLSPPPSLFSLPWAGLPSRIGQGDIVAPTLNAKATGPPSRQGHVALIAGPDLLAAEEELAGISAAVDVHPSRPGTVVQAGTTAGEALSALDGASIAHIVAHGTVRTDNPLFSSLRMADGELSVYELGDLERPPGIVVLSACHVGLAADAPGQELLGMVTGFLNAGTSCVIASTLPIPDNRSTVDIMTRLHTFLAEGMSPAVAWAEVQRTCPDEDQLLDTAAFTVFGRG